jgi:hypothetical protein
LLFCSWISWNFEHLLPLILSKIHTVCSHGATSVAVKLLLSIHMDPMSDVRMTQENLTAQECQAMSLVALGSAEILNSSLFFKQNPHCIQPWHHISCCQSASIHPYGSNEWC